MVVGSVRSDLGGTGATPGPLAVLFDRDGTLVVDVPYNGDPARVAPVPGAAEQLLSPLGPVFVCEHGPDDGCACHKPAPRLVLQAAAALGVPPQRCVVVGDIGADVAVFEDDTPVPTLERLRPDVFVKGGDYALTEIPEAAVLAGWGGQAVVLPYLDGRSTSALIEQVAVRG